MFNLLTVLHMASGRGGGNASACVTSRVVTYCDSSCLLFSPGSGTDLLAHISTVVYVQYSLEDLGSSSTCILPHLPSIGVTLADLSIS